MHIYIYIYISPYYAKTPTDRQYTPRHTNFSKVTSTLHHNHAAAASQLSQPDTCTAITVHTSLLNYHNTAELLQHYHLPSRYSSRNGPPPYHAGNGTVKPDVIQPHHTTSTDTWISQPITTHILHNYRSHAKIARLVTRLRMSYKRGKSAGIA